MTYDPNKRVAQCPDPDACQMSRIEVDFAIPVLMTQDQQRRLVDLMSEIVQSPWNEPLEGVHWVGSIGCKPNWSAIDAALLGVPVGANPPANGEEPTHDEDVFAIGSMAREFVTEKERERVLKERT